MVTTIDYRRMASATREQLISALDPRREMSQSDVLAQLERVDGREREQRMLDLTRQIRWLTGAAVLASVAAVILAAASLLSAH